MHRMRMFHCSPHLPGPALHVPYRHCPIPTPARMPHIEILRQSVMMISENLRRNAACDVLRVAMCWLYLSKRGTSWLKLGPSELYHIRIRPSATLHDQACSLDLRELLLRSISVPVSTLATERLVDNVVSQIKQLSDDLVCLAANCIVVHDIGREGLATLDLLSRLARVVVVDVHL